MTRGEQPRSRILLTVVLLTVVAVLATACGGGDAEGTTASTEAGAMTTVATEATGAAVAGAGAEVTGLVDNPTTLTADTLEAMDVVEISAEHPKLGPTVYRGVLLSELLPTLGVQSTATAVTVAATDGYRVEIPLADVEASADAMLAITEDGTLTLVIPGMPAKNWVKKVATIEFK